MEGDNSAALERCREDIGLKGESDGQEKLSLERSTEKKSRN